MIKKAVDLDTAADILRISSDDAGRYGPGKGSPAK